MLENPNIRTKSEFLAALAVCAHFEQFAVVQSDRIELGG